MASLLRNLMVALSLDPSPLEKGVDKAKRSLGEAEKAAQRHQDALDKVGTVAAVAGGAMVAGFGAAVAATIDFDKAMSNVGAVSNASAEEMEKLRQAALKAGKDTVYSATEAAQAEAELAKTGISTADILGGALTGSLALAAAGQLDLEEAATLSGQAMKIFSLQGKDVSHIADVLAAGANKSAADVHQLGEALRAGGLVAAQAGASMEETVGILSAFADNALIGSDAGTSLKTMLLHLMGPSDKSAALMDELGISVYDASGKFVSFANLAQQLQVRLGHLSAAERDAAMAQIFGTDAIRGANILYKLGAAGVEEYTDAVNDNGAATRVAAQNLDNLAGDLEQLKGSIETALIQGGSAATGVLRGLTQTAGNLVDLFNELPAPVQGTATVLTGLVGAVSAVAGAFVLGAPKVAEFKNSLSDLGPRGQKFGRALMGVGSFLTGPWGLALAGGAVALGIFANRHAEAEKKVAELTDALMANSGALDENAKASIRNRLESDGVLAAAQKLKLSLSDVTEAALGNEGAMARVSAGLKEAKTRANALDEQYGGGVAAAQEYSHNALRVRGAIDGVNGELAEARERYKRLQEATPKTAAGVKSVGDAADLAAEQVKDLKDEINGFNALQGNVTGTTIAFRNHIDELREAFRKNGLQIDRNTGSFKLNNKANRENATLVIDAIRKAGEHSQAVFKNTDNVNKANAAFKRQIDVIRGVLREQGLSRGEIDKLIGKYVDLKNKVNSATKGIKDKNVLISVKADGKFVGYMYKGQTLHGGGRPLASGGILPGYTPGRDVHDFYSPTGGALRLSGGEAVMRPEWTRAVGADYVNAMNAAARRGGVNAVAAAMGVPSRWTSGRDAIGLEGAAFAGGGIITKGSVSGAGQVRETAQKADVLYGAWARQIGSAVAKRLTTDFYGGPGVQRALAWARGQAGKPYVWGGVGPHGYDCSGMWSAVVNVLKGRNPYSRLFTTFSFTGASQGPQGFVRNLRSPVMVGVTNAGVGHMAGTLAGVNVESRGSAGVVVGPNARGANNSLFGMRYGLKFDEGGVMPPGHGTYYNGTRKPEYVFTQRQMERMGGDTIVIEKMELRFADDRNMYEKGREFAEGLREYKRRGGKIPSSP